MNKYRELVKEINELHLNAQKRTARAQYLRNKADVNKKVNPEQAEAYILRLNLHKWKLILTLEKIEKLEEKLKDTPRTWIG